MAPLNYRYLERDKSLGLSKYAGDFDHVTDLSKNAKDEIRWWLNNVRTAEKPIKIPTPSVFIETDASSLGWGAVFQGESTGGRWSETEALGHINALELKAIFLGINSFCKNMTHTHIRVKTDNSTAVAYLNNMGGSKSLKCNHISKLIWNWCIQRHIYLSAEHLPGVENIVADKESRHFSKDTEWMLDLPVFRLISERFWNFSIDLFASRLNT